MCSLLMNHPSARNQYISFDYSVSLKIIDINFPSFGDVIGIRFAFYDPLEVTNDMLPRV